MGQLLQNLGLRPTPAMVRRAAITKAQEEPTDAKKLTVGGAPEVGVPLKPSAADKKKEEKPAQPGAERDDPARAAAQALKPELAKKELKARELVQAISGAQGALDKQLKAATGAAKTELLKKKATLDEHADKAASAHAQARADLDAVDDPQARRETLVAILARAKSKAQPGELIEIENAPGLTGQKRTERQETSTTTTYADGRATTIKEDKKTSVGLDGVTATKSKETTSTTAAGTMKSSNETTTKVGPKGYSQDKKSTLEVEADGKTVKLEKGSSVAVGPDGAKRSNTVSVTKTDGSSTAITKDEALERGDGKLLAGKSKTTTTTSASGTEVKATNSGKACMVADGENYGGSAEGKREVGVKNKDGIGVGAVGGLHANVTCSIGDPAGEPPRYPLTLKVNLGAEIALTGGVDKEGGKAKGGFSFTGGADVYMNATHHLTTAQAREYVQALEDASKGSKAAPTHKEFAIIHAGVRDGWQVAQAMWKGGGKPLSPAMLASLKAVGDSVEIGGKKTKGAAANLDAKVVSIEAGVEVTEESSTKATRNQDGGLDIAVNSSETTKGSVKVGVSLDGVGGSVGRSRTVKTSFGYDITVDAKKDPQGQIVQALVACKSAADYEKFIVTHKGRITVVSRKTGKALSESEMVGLSIAGLEASIGLHQGVAEEKQVDASGKLISSTTVGSAGAGGGVKGGKLAVGDSVEDRAVARRDGDGNASLDLTSTKSATRADKMLDWAKSKLPFGHGDKDKDKEKDTSKQKGLLAKAAGAKDEEPDTQSHDVFGLLLSNKDLDAIGKRAANESEWMHAVQRHQELDDWRSAGRKIRASGGDRGVVADELARFVGGDKIHRLETLKRFLRPGGDVSIGKAYGFPDSLAKQRKEYDELVVKPCEEQIRAVAAKEGAAKAAEFGQKLFDRVEALRLLVDKATDFGDKGAQAEMLSDLAHRKTAVANVMRELAGKNSAADQQAAAEEAFGRLNRECVKYVSQQEALFAAIRKLLGSRDRILVADFAEGERCVRQLSDLRAIWKRDLKEMIALAQANNIPERRYKDNQPNDAEYERLKKACWK